MRLAAGLEPECYTRFPRARKGLRHATWRHATGMASPAAVPMSGRSGPDCDKTALVTARFITAAIPGRMTVTRKEAAE
jgi:hypothetical protein